MVPQTEADRFILQQVQSVLEPGEQVVQCAYLAPVVGGGSNLGTFMRAATLMAAFAVLTDRRLILIQTRIGAFKPLLENHGIQSFDRQTLKGVFIGSSLLLELADGHMLEYQNNSAKKDVSTQAEFFRQLPQVFGTSEGAARVARNQRLQSVVGLAVGAVIAAVYLWYKFHS
jgi:hypothetical protein